MAEFSKLAVLHELVNEKVHLKKKLFKYVLIQYHFIIISLYNKCFVQNVCSDLILYEKP